MINLKTPKQKLNEWKTQNNMRRNYEIKLASSLKKEFLRASKNISTNYIISRNSAVDLESRPHHSRLKSIIFTHWKAVTDVFRDRSLSMLRNVIEKEQKEEYMESEAATPKKIVETISKESFFAEIEKLKTENNNLIKQIEE